MRGVWRPSYPAGPCGVCEGVWNVPRPSRLQRAASGTGRRGPALASRLRPRACGPRLRRLARPARALHGRGGRVRVVELPPERPAPRGLALPGARRPSARPRFARRPVPALRARLDARRAPRRAAARRAPRRHVREPRRSAPGVAGPRPRRPRRRARRRSSAPTPSTARPRPRRRSTPDALALRAASGPTSRRARAHRGGLCGPQPPRRRAGVGRPLDRGPRPGDASPSARACRSTRPSPATASRAATCAWRACSPTTSRRSGAPFPIQAGVRATGFGGRATRLVVTEGGRTLGTAPLALPADGGEATVDVAVTPTAPGLRTLHGHGRPARGRGDDAQQPPERDRPRPLGRAAGAGRRRRARARTSPRSAPSSTPTAACA